MPVDIGLDGLISAVPVTNTVGDVFSRANIAAPWPRSGSIAHGRHDGRLQLAISKRLFILTA